MNLNNKKKAELIALIEKLQKDGIALHSENKELTEKVFTAKRKINSYVSQINELTEENKQLHEKISADKEYYNALTQENKALNEKVKNLYKEISTNREKFNKDVVDLQNIATDAMTHRNQALRICGSIILFLLFVIVILFVL